MEENGSPLPRFDFDPDRTWFRATLPAHPEYAAVSALQDAAYLRTVGGFDDAFQRVRDSWKANSASAVLAVEMIRLYAERDDLDQAEGPYSPDSARWGRDPQYPTLRIRGSKCCSNTVERATRDGFLKNLQRARRRRTLSTLPSWLGVFGNPASPTAFFNRPGDAIQADSRALHEFAQTKIWLAQEARRQRRRAWHEVNRRLLVEARGLLERVVSMDASPTRHAWAWRDLARTLNWLRAPASEVEAAFERALAVVARRATVRRGAGAIPRSTARAESPAPEEPSQRQALNAAVSVTPFLIGEQVEVRPWFTRRRFGSQTDDRWIRTLRLGLRFYEDEPQIDRCRRDGCAHIS